VQRLVSRPNADGRRALVEVKVGLLMLVGVGLLAALVLVMGGVHLGKPLPRRGRLQQPRRPPGRRPGEDRRRARGPGRPDGVPRAAASTRARAAARSCGCTPTSTSATAASCTPTRPSSSPRRACWASSFSPSTRAAPRSPRSTSTRPVEGIDPPRIDLFLARAYSLLDDTVTAMRANRRQLGGHGRRPLGRAPRHQRLLRRNGPRIDSILENVDRAVRDADGLVLAARDRYVDGPQARRILNRAESVLADHRARGAPARPATRGP
jgi:hypothetical protein